MKKKRMWLTVFSVLLMLILWGVVQPTLSPAGGPGKKSQLKSPVAYDYTDQLIVKYRNSSLVQKAASNNISALNAINERVNALSSLAGVALMHFRFMSGDGHVIKLPKKMTLAEAKAIARSLRADPNVEYAVPDRRMFPMLVPNDTEYVNQWHYHRPSGPSGPSDPDQTPAEPSGVNLPGAWDITIGVSGIVVAVIDTGIVTHADLAGRTVAGYDFISNATVANDGGGRDNNPSDPGDWCTAAEQNDLNSPCYNLDCAPGCISQINSSWHGTHVAGTIGALSNNSLGVAGINWTSKILPVRVLGKGGGDESDIIDGMRWAAGLTVAGVPANANPAKVLNMSLGAPGACSDDPALQTAIEDIMAAGVTIVVAAGNSNTDAEYFSPAGCRGVITVVAFNRAASRAAYSNHGHQTYFYGPLRYLAAPGGEKACGTDPRCYDPNGVLSTLNTGTTTPNAGGDSYIYYEGTSMAAPHVAGIASLMLSVNSNLLPHQIADIMTFNETVWPQGSNCYINQDCGSLVNAALAVTATQNYLNQQTDLSLTVADATPTSSPLLVGTSFFHTVNIINNGPADPRAINITWTPSGTATVGAILTLPYASIREDLNGIGIGSGFESIDWYQLPIDASPMTFHATPVTTGTITYTVNISSAMNDPDLSNNTLTFTYNVENPVPVISSLSPSSAIAGTAAFTLTVNGSNFSGESTVQWNGVARPTTFVNFTQLTATISAADIATAGAANVTVVSPAPGGGTSNTSTFTISAVAPTPTPSTNVRGKSGNICFIATAAFGSPLEKHVQILRDFRDRILLNSAAGKSFVNFYYEVSPPIAQTIAQNEALRLLTRWGLMPVVGVAYLTLHWGVTVTLFLMLITLLIFIGLAWTVRKKLRNA